MKTIHISEHVPALTELAMRHRIPVAEVVDRILQDGMAREDHLFGWSPAPSCGTEPASIEEWLPAPAHEPVREMQSA
jgi:hypothetical protein